MAQEKIHARCSPINSDFARKIMRFIANELCQNDCLDIFYFVHLSLEGASQGDDNLGIKRA